MTKRLEDARVQFAEIDWVPVAAGAREKVEVAGGRRMRLLELTEAFEETDWCRSPHWGVLLEGTMAIELPGGATTLEPGDGLALPDDDAHRHKASVPSGERALLFLVEPRPDA